MSERLRILHLSDVHHRVGLPWMSAERQKTIRTEARSRHRVLGPPLEDILRKDVLTNGPPDIITFTGDIADWGLKEEYTVAEQQIRRILEITTVPRDRFYAIPGNHDVARKRGEDAWRGVRTIAKEPSTLPDIGQWMCKARALRGTQPA